MRLDPLFRPESIAVIGASEKRTPGRRIIASLERIGFAGRIFPVNPNYPSVLNRPCYASPAELPEAPDVAVFCLGHERVLSALEAAAKRGMKAAVIYDGGFAEQARKAGRCRRGSLRFASRPASRYAVPTAWVSSTRTTRARPICRNCASLPGWRVMSRSFHIAAGSASAC
jgi:acyl-CoA synthetase (NDP forming)